MSRTTILIVLLAGAAAAAGFAQALTVTYLDGVVEMQSARGWAAVAIGDKIPADATVRVSQGGSLELLREKTKITLLKDGVYSVASVAAAAGKAGSGVGGAIAQKLQSLVAQKPRGATAGGVRAEQQGKSGVTWVDESDEEQTKAQDLLDNRQYDEAARLLTTAIKDAGPDEDTAELSYMLGTAYYGLGQLARSYHALEKVAARPEAAWFVRFDLLKAQVLVDTQNYSDALDLLTAFVAANPTGEAAQYAWLLTGLCQKGLGNREAARSAMDSGFQLDPASDAARLIDQQRRAL